MYSEERLRPSRTTIVTSLTSRPDGVARGTMYVSTR
jgi:hypothetical protein